MSFTTISFMSIAIVILVHSLWFVLPSRWVYTMLLFLSGLYGVLTFPVGNFVFATGGIIFLTVISIGLLICSAYFYQGGSRRNNLIFIILFFFLVVLFLLQPIWWVLQIHSSGVGLDFSSGYTPAGYLLDGVTAADFKGLVFIGMAAYAVVELHHRSANNSAALEPLVLAMIAVGAGLITFNVDNLIVLYLNLELQALALYTIVGYSKHRAAIIDSSLRYLLAGSLISGITLIGFVQVYGVNGTFQLSQVHFGGGTGTIWILGMLLFKLGAAPFYFWTPIVYQPLDFSTLALVVGPAKVNLWYLLVIVLSPVTMDSFVWTHVIIVVGLMSVMVGAVGGYFQTSVTSLLAYSGVLNTGYLLLLSVSEFVTFNFSFYLAMYLLSTSAVVLVLSLFSNTAIQSYSFVSRLGKSTPLALYYLLLNLAGLPVFPGFFGKVYLVDGILPLGWLTVGVVIAFSIVPGLYYVGIAAQALFAWSQQENKVTQPGAWSSAAAAILTTSIAAAAALLWHLFF